jgi:hypothetical protein
MLDILSNLETLASRVKTLEKPCGVVTPQNIEDVLQQKKMTRRGHMKNPRSVSDVAPTWDRLEKEKWRALDTHDVLDSFTRIPVVSSPLYLSRQVETPSYFCSLNVFILACRCSPWSK